MDDFEKTLQECLQDEEFKKEWKNTELEYQITRMLVAARNEKQLTQKQLAEASGVRQSNISRIENGNCVPSIATLEALAEGLGKQLKIELV
ncbi:MAG: helix-turn-helix transcriptional regulator [Firmicutes bacterium]|nr:helix-turn-helix transcriptional regulator [Bacillota bacterium]